MSWRAVLIAAAVASVASISAAQEETGPSADNPRIDLPLIGEVTVPGFLAGLFGSQDDGGGSAPQGQQGGNATAVVVEPARPEPVGDSYRFLGRIVPIEEVAVQARISGFIETVSFEGGDVVAEGDPLFQIQRAQYQAALEAAEAQLAGAEAAFRETERQADRQRELAQSGTVSEANLDDALANLESARAERLQAEAAVTQAELDLGYTSIDAAIAGQMSAPELTRGNYVSPQTGTLAELVQLDPIWGVFALGENRLAAWRQIGINGSGSGEAGERPLSAEDYTLRLVLPDGSDYGEAGSFDFIGNRVDPETGTVSVRVRFANPDGLLLPNQNVTLLVEEADPPVRPVVSQAALQLGREGSAVWVVRENDTVQRLPVETEPGPRPGTVAVTNGLSGGERVVVRGALSLSEGQSVDPRQADGGASSVAGNGGQ